MKKQIKLKIQNVKYPMF